MRRINKFSFLWKIKTFVQETSFTVLKSKKEKKKEDRKTIYWFCHKTNISNINTGAMELRE